jgi:hypothetical protein
MDEVGAYLLKTFYEDDPALYRDPRAPNHVSLRALAARCGGLDLPVSASFISTSIRIAAVGRAMPAGASFLKLPMSHRAELVRLPPEKIESAAALAIRTAAPVRELREHVTRLLPAKSSSRGRPPTPPALRVLKEVARALGNEARPVTHADVAKLTAKQRAEMVATIAAAKKYITALQDALRDNP